MCDFINERITYKTRRDHRCFWCNQLIPKGSATMRKSWKYDGDMSYGHFHPECHDAETLWWKDNRDCDEGYFPGTFKRGSTEER